MIHQMHVSLAQKADLPEIAYLIVNSFREDFLCVTNDIDKLTRAIALVIDENRFFVIRRHQSIIATLACSDQYGRAVKIHTPDMIPHLGHVRRILKGQAAMASGAPLPTYAHTGYIEFVSVDESERRKGIATQLLRQVIQSTHYDEFLLDVVDTNHAAIACYQKLGFVELDRVHDTKVSIQRYQNRIYMGYLK